MANPARSLPPQTSHRPRHPLRLPLPPPQPPAPSSETPIPRPCSVIKPAGRVGREKSAATLQNQDAAPAERRRLYKEETLTTWCASTTPRSRREVREEAKTAARAAVATAGSNERESRLQRSPPRRLRERGGTMQLARPHPPRHHPRPTTVSRGKPVRPSKHKTSSKTWRDTLVSIWGGGQLPVGDATSTDRARPLFPFLFQPTWSKGSRPTAVAARVTAATHSPSAPWAKHHSMLNSAGASRRQATALACVAARSSTPRCLPI